jgi:NADH-quinone oxidoreductase subunit N
MDEDPAALLPELCLAAGAVLGLLAGSWLPRRRQWVVRWLAVAACAAGLAATVAAWPGPARTVFGASYALDSGLAAARLAVLAATALAVLLAAGQVAGHPRESEYYVLVLLAGLGAVTLAGANDLMLLAAGYLLASVPLYALVGFGKDAPGTEASLKYYLMGALLGVLLLAGVAVLLGAGGATGYPQLATGLRGAPAGLVAVGTVGVLAGLAFKLGAAPAQFWVPDVARGTTPAVAAFVTTVPKLGALVAAYRLAAEVLPAGTHPAALFAVLAAASMTLGNLAAFAQTDVRRLLGYSTISQIGYLLMAVAAAGHSRLALPALAVYLAAYAVTNLGAFAVVCALPGAETIAAYRGLFHRRPLLALSLVVCLLGLVGTPPTAVFVGKLTVFTAALDARLAWLVVLAAANTVASLFYYLRWIAPLFQRPTADVAVDLPVDLPQVSRWPAAVAYLTAATSVLLGVLAGPLLHAFDTGLQLR